MDEMEFTEAESNKPQPAVATNRSDVLKQFAQAAALKGTSADGRAIFQARCSACHKLGGIGNAVGPDLAALTDKTPQTLLIGTIDPNREVSEQYTAFLVRLKSGSTLGGMIANGPISYQVDDTQFVAVASGHSLFVFALAD